MEKYLNKFIRNAPKETDILEIYAVAEEMEREGRKVIHMDIGRPDFDTPKVVKDRAIQALKEGYVHYTSLNGVAELKEAIARREHMDNKIIADAASEILVTVGASEALFNIWLNFLGEGDEILMMSPCYGAYIYQLACVGASVMEVPVIKDGRAWFDINDFRNRITKRTKMIMVNTPHNPTGMVLTRQQLEEIAQLALEYDLLVVSDECYDKYVFDGEHVSISTMTGMKDRTITVNSTSKTFAMTGWRVGYAIGNSFLIEKMGLSHCNMVLCAPSFAQIGAIEAFDNVYGEVDFMMAEFKKRREYITDVLKSIPEISFVRPEGAFYIFMDVGKLCTSGTEFCKRYLKEYQVAATPGVTFGAAYKKYVRLAYTCSFEDVSQAMDRLVNLTGRLKEES